VYFLAFTLLKQEVNTMNMETVTKLGNNYSFRSGHALEISTYAVLAVLLIQHILTLETIVGRVDAVATLLGATFGLMASCQLTPISALTGLSGRKTTIAEVFSLHQPPKTAYDSDDQHKAA
jgi:hypothetical protein